MTVLCTRSRRELATEWAEAHRQRAERESAALAAEKQARKAEKRPVLAPQPPNPEVKE
ncbi:MAG: hypothetical protein RJA59_420 [Pseudomonadota bacterium]